MHLVYIEKSAYNDEGGFKINKPSADNQYIDLEKAFKTFVTDERQEKMKEYEELRDKEKQLAKDRRELLLSLKTEFKEEFIPEFQEEFPEFFI